MLNKLRASGRSKGTSFAAWAIIALLFVGLTGLGLGGAVTGLASQNVAQVGDEQVNRDDYVRTLLDQINRFSQQVGQPMSMSQARLFGLDEQVLNQMITRAAIDDKTRDMGLSVGDQIVAEQLLRAQQFQGVTGGFDEDAYDFYLDRNRLTASDYEDRLRQDVSRSMLELAVAAGTEMPPVVVETILAFAGETRTFSYVALGPDDLDSVPELPDEATLQTYYEANPDRYTSEEARVVVYAALTPEDLLDEVEVSEEELQAAYAERDQIYNRPETRVLDLLAFGTEADAQAARDAIDAGDTTFAALGEERGLTPAEMSLGALQANDLNSTAREAVFATDGPGVVGPVATDLGPALYRVNAVIAATEQSFEDVRDELRIVVAQQLSGEAILDHYDAVADLVASGAPVEEIADATPLSLSEVEILSTPGDGVAADLAFRREVFEAEVGDEPDLIEMENGGLAVLRLERIEEPALLPLDDVAEQATGDWRAEQIRIALVERVEAMDAALSEGRTFDAVVEAEGLTKTVVGPITRNDPIAAGLPAETSSQVFSLEDGTSAVISDLGQVFLIQVTDVTPVDTSSEAYTAELDAAGRELNGALSATIYLSFAQTLADQAGISVNQQLIEDSLAHYP